MNRIKRAILRVIINRLANRGLSVVRTDLLAEAGSALEGTATFCARSGFLRDGRMPGGKKRHAERKIHGGVSVAYKALADGILPAV